MSTRWDDWIHATITTYGTWLPGRSDGFRNRQHRIHSSGDYKNPPPGGEHAGLFAYASSRSAAPIVIPAACRMVVAEAIAAKLLSAKCSTRVVAVSAVHAHALVCVGDIDAKPLMGRAKQQASHRVRRELPGSIWAQGCHVVRIANEAHFLNTLEYIRKHESDGASNWEPVEHRK